MFSSPFVVRGDVYYKIRVNSISFHNSLFSSMLGLPYPDLDSIQKERFYACQSTSFFIGIALNFKLKMWVRCLYRQSASAWTRKQDGTMSVRVKVGRKEGETKARRGFSCCFCSIVGGW